MAKFQKIISRSSSELIPGELNLPHVKLACGHTAFYTIEQMKKVEAGTDLKRLCKECK